MIDDTTMHLIRRRETMEDLLATEMEITSEL
jgi:hypothetical protein